MLVLQDGDGQRTLLIVAVGRTLAPMLALAPAPSPRRGPLAEAGLTSGLWLLVAGIALGAQPLAAVGIVVALLALTGFARRLAGVARRRRSQGIEGPLAHLLAGALFVVQAAALSLAGLFGAAELRRAAIASAFLLLVGWAAGVIAGHLGKLLSLSTWASRPPGSRPKQRALYPLRPWQGEALAFAAAVELVAVGILAASPAVTRAGAGLLCASAVLALAGASLTLRRVWAMRPAGSR